MTLQQLKYIVALEQHRHFVAAAKSCFVAQPTMTLQVKKLEEEINLQIFDRSVKPLVPTPLGKLFIDKSKLILREVEELKALVNEEINELKGEFTLAVIPTLAPYLIPLFIESFSQQFPDIHLNIMELQTKEIINRLNNNTVDIGILVTPIKEKAIKEIPLFYEPFLVFASKEHPLSAAPKVKESKLKTPTLWLLKEGHCFRSQTLKICKKEKEYSTALSYSFESGSIETLKNMVRNNTGYTLVPELSINKKIDLPYLRKFNDPQPVREISLVAHNNFTKALLLENLKKEILKSIPKNFKKNHKGRLINWM